MEAFLVSTGLVALAEMGDKTQLLSLLLAARFRKPWPIVAGIFVATLANHALAGALGAWVTNVLGADTLRWILGGSFIAHGRLDADPGQARRRGCGYARPALRRVRDHASSPSSWPRWATRRRSRP